MVIIFSFFFVCLGKSSSKASKEQEFLVSEVTSLGSAKSSSTSEQKKQSARPIASFCEGENVAAETNARSPDAKTTNAKVLEESRRKDVCKIHFILNQILMLNGDALNTKLL